MVSSCYDTVNIRFKDREVLKQLFYEDGSLMYSGSTVSGLPYGPGTVFYPDRTIYQEGLFGVKGLLSGREYYPSGQLRFEGIYKMNKGYGPNYPVYGKCFDMHGDLYFEGLLSIRNSGLGYPFVEEPAQYGKVVQDGSPLFHRFMWDDVAELENYLYKQ